ncbi:hypothetical protein PpBr36_05070 [Pyricularia pennisetigena]|uniref:hypothetical protein n=1 Tax=Pyricularia pennisetigena TaxID=1578925 RepID=UPI001151ECDB|nr:hypothetical protein PpBr36_05070 [Pyricularia pennisetigena]TLS26942.1 hypothetical protein PpBr36_05070 [Pyricularia pennisetigena]
MQFHTIIGSLAVMASLGAANPFSAKQPINQFMSHDILQFKGIAKSRTSPRAACNEQDHGSWRRPITACIRAQAPARF